MIVAGFYLPKFAGFILPFTINNKTGEIYQTRLSNGPIESMNRVIKDMKRHARGYKNFQVFRNRFLFSQRKNAPILAIPKSLAEIKNIGSAYKRKKLGSTTIFKQNIRVRKYKHERRKNNVSRKF